MATDLGKEGGIIYMSPGSKGLNLCLDTIFAPTRAPTAQRYCDSAPPVRLLLLHVRNSTPAVDAVRATAMLLRLLLYYIILMHMIRAIFTWNVHGTWQ